MNEALKLLAPDLSKTFPRSPREKLGGFVIAARALDKCRAVLAGTAGEYHFDCPLDRQFFDFSGCDSEAFKLLVSKGATDIEVDAWIRSSAQVKDATEIVVWNNKLRYTRICDMPAELQVYLESYIDTFVRKNRPVYVWFDLYDIEEQRL